MSGINVGPHKSRMWLDPYWVLTEFIHALKNTSATLEKDIPAHFTDTAHGKPGFIPSGDLPSWASS